MRRLWIAVALLALALLPTAIHSVTTVSPGSGTSSGSAGTGSSATTSQFSNAGQSWQLAPGLSGDFDPLKRVDFPSIPLNAGQLVWCFYTSDINLACFGRAAPVTSGAIEGYFDNAGGPTIRAVSQQTGFWSAASNEVNGVRNISTGGFAFASGRNTCTLTDGPFYVSSAGVAPATAVPCFGGINSVNHISLQNVDTFLAHAGNTGTPYDSICRSTNRGGQWFCGVIPVITGYTGGGGFRLNVNGGHQNFAPVSANTWLAIGNDSGDGFARIIRSTDDGQTWTQVHATGVAISVSAAVQCLSSSVCLAINAGNTVYRSSDGGVTWSIILAGGPLGTGTRWQGIIVFDSLTVSLTPWGGGNGSGLASVGHSSDGGLTWSFSNYTGGVNGTCPQSSGAEGGLQSVAIRNGRAIVISRYGSTTSPASPCVHYTSFGGGSTSIAGPLGVPLAINALGEAPVAQGSGSINSNATPWFVSPTQRATIFNSSTTGAANTAVPITIAASLAQRARVYAIEAFCAAAGTGQLTIADNAVTIYTPPAAGTPPPPATLRREWTAPLTSTITNTAMVITAGACGAGNTTTLHVQADRY